MMTASQFSIAQSFIDASWSVEDFGALASLLDSSSKELGFSHYALVNHVDVRTQCIEPFRIHSYPDHWAHEFATHRRVTSDPVVLASYTTSIGFRWSDIPAMIPMTNAHRAILRAAYEQGIGDGYTVPAHVPGEANGSCSFAQPVGKHLPESSLSAAQLIGSYAFQAARVLLHKQARDLPHDPVRLTARQLDCILLVARGKTDWEISKILGIREETVTEYLDEARRRYNVSRRVQLVMRSIHDGHLTLADTLV
jgi:LuxR family transcriptional regulator, quorum-sensing system regulator CciR